MHLGRLLISAACVAAAFIAPSSAVAQQGEVVETFACESVNGSHNECQYRASGTVTVHINRQLSSSRCVFNETWGSFDGGVWVDYGCRAEFAVRRPPQQNQNYRPVGGTMETVTCQSTGGGYNECRVPGIDASSVAVEHQLSRTSCTRGSSWGVSEGENSPPGIWVDRGCRAIFAYTTRDAAHPTYAGTPHDFELPCESIRGAWNHCEVRHAHNARIELINGNQECNGYKAWGVDDTGIWVRNNCQAAFSVRYRH